MIVSFDLEVNGWLMNHLGVTEGGEAFRQTVNRLEVKTTCTLKFTQS